MQVLHPRCAGLDVHKDSVVAAVRLAEAGGTRCGVRRFDTTTPGLLALGAWLAECGCTHAPRVMCGRPPRCKGFLDATAPRSGAVMCPASMCGAHDRGP
jgi:hypothetical protein